MSVLRLDTAARVFHGGAEIGEIWRGGARLWAKPAAADPLAAYYGLGAGQITDYFSLRDAGGHTLAASGADQVITRITNKGGSARHLTGVAASAPRSFSAPFSISSCLRKRTWVEMSGRVTASVPDSPQQRSERSTC